MGNNLGEGEFLSTAENGFFLQGKEKDIAANSLPSFF